MSLAANAARSRTRCATCIMPASVPGADFDAAGVCRWCRSGFPNYRPLGDERLHEQLAEARRSRGAADCLVALSGGKDSSYAALELKETFGLRVEAFTYVYTGLSPFALENARKTCRALGIRHHVVSLPRDIHLRSFKAFFEAWVESGSAVAAGMSCVACKHMHLLGTRLARRRGIGTVVWAICPLEAPPFLPTRVEGKSQDQRKGPLGLGILLAQNMLLSERFSSAFWSFPGTCLMGSLAFHPPCRFLRLRYPSVRHLQFFEYCRWDPQKIRARLESAVGWSLPGRVKRDWHSDCLMHVFKEYMFQKMYRASYLDAFLSNQVRAGVLTRTEAYEKLLASKEYYARELPEVVSALGLDHLRAKIDFSCFDV
ncbi:MAG: hypothetical protein ACUVUC_03410 [Thermoguttaceae bacterium]